MANLVTGNGRQAVDYAQPKHRTKSEAAEAAAFALHPEVQRATAEFSDALRERDQLREENLSLKNHVKVLEAHIAELQWANDTERTGKERYQRYSVVVQTLIGSMARAAQQAHDAAVEHAVKEEPKQIPTVSKIEQEVAALAKTLRSNEGPDNEKHAAP